MQYINSSVEMNESSKLLISIFKIGHVYVKTKNVVKLNIQFGLMSFVGKLLERRKRR